MRTFSSKGRGVKEHMIFLAKLGEMQDLYEAIVAVALVTAIFFTVSMIDALS